MTPLANRERRPHEGISQTIVKRLAGLFIVAGVLVQGLSLFWTHPLSFMAFLGVGSVAVFVGIVVYLLALVSPQESE